jgi:hypothetical protein
MFVFRASSIDERNRIIQCLFARAKHCSNHQCTKHKLDEPGLYYERIFLEFKIKDL